MTKYHKVGIRVECDGLWCIVLAQVDGLIYGQAKGTVIPLIVLFIKVCKKVGRHTLWHVATTHTSGDGEIRRVVFGKATAGALSARLILDFEDRLDTVLVGRPPNIGIVCHQIILA